jgi:hypothetical protein
MNEEQTVQLSLMLIYESYNPLAHNDNLMQRQ